MSNNVVNLRNIHPTELKFNTRVIPPVMSTSNSEAAITNQEEEVRRSLNNYFKAVIKQRAETEDS